MIKIFELEISSDLSVLDHPEFKSIKKKVCAVFDGI